MGVGGPPLEHDAHDLRNDVARASDDDGIADPDVFARQFIHIVQGRIADRDAADESRLQARNRRQCTGAPNLKFDVAYGRERLLRREFVRNSPTWRARNEPELTLRLQIVDLVHHAVDLIRQAIPHLADFPVVLEAAVDRLDDAGLRTDLESPLPQSLQQRALVARQLAALDVTDPIDEQIERSCRREARVELTQAAGRCVARIDEGLLAARERLRIELLESCNRHEDFAAHLENARIALAPQFDRQRSDRLEIRRDVFALLPVTARRALQENAALVDGADCEPVELRLG